MITVTNIFQWACNIISHIVLRQIWKERCKSILKNSRTLVVNQKGHLKENGTKNTDRNSITQTYYIVRCHIKSEYNHFSMVACVRHSRPFSSGMLEESNVSRSLLYSVLSISALGMEVFLRWIVRSDTGCLGVCDILEAMGEQRITNVPTASITQWHTDSQLISFQMEPHSPCTPFTPQQIHISTSPKPTAELTGKGRPVIDKNLHNDKTAWNQVLLTSCNVSRKRRWDELEEAMGNTANFEGATLYALQSVLTIWSFKKNKTRMRRCLPMPQLDPMSVIITKSVLRGGMMHRIAVGVISWWNIKRLYTQRNNHEMIQ